MYTFPQKTKKQQQKTTTKNRILSLSAYLQTFQKEFPKQEQDLKNYKD